MELNQVKLAYGGLVPGLSRFSLLAASKNDARFKSGQKATQKNHLNL